MPNTGLRRCRSWPASLICGLLSTSALLSFPGAATNTNRQSISPVERLRLWLEAVREHVPGQPDRAATSLASWQRREWNQGLTAIQLFADFLREPNRKRPRFAYNLSSQEILTVSQIAAAVSQPDGGARVLKRAATLHLDIVVLGLEPTASQSGEFDRPVALASDGASMGTSSTTQHWTIARTLLDAVTSAPAQDSFVGDWYRAATAFMAGRHLLADLRPHLERARELFGEGSEIALQTGCMYETFATSRIQQGAASARARGLAVEIPGSSASLREAERRFRLAVGSEATSAEASLRLGRVLSLQGKNDAARAPLMHARNLLSESSLLYLSALFLGVVEQELGDFDRSAEFFDEAGSRFPMSQSAALASESLALVSGRPSGDGRRLADVLAVSPSSPARHDPWWDYDLCSGRYAGRLLEALYGSTPSAR